MLGREKCELDVAVRKGGGCEGENIYDGWLFFGVQGVLWGGGGLAGPGGRQYIRSVSLYIISATVITLDLIPLYYEYLRLTCTLASSRKRKLPRVFTQGR